MRNKKFFIPGSVPSSKNGRRWTGKYFIASKTVVNYRKKTKEYFEKHASEFAEEFNKYETPVEVAFTFVRGTKHKFDYINPCQTVQDDMVKHKWLPDDNAEYIIPKFRKYKYNKNKPGVYIQITSNNKLKDGIE